MRLIINLILVVLIFGLIWVLYSSISEPIAFKAELERRKDAVVERLMQVRAAQELYRDVTGRFANDFDTLNQVLQTGKIQVISVYGDPDDPSNTEAIRYDTTYEAAMDKVESLGLNLDSLRYVPYSTSAKFSIQADTLTYQSSLVNVVEVGTPYKTFMGPYASPHFARYDNTYDPEMTIKFGNMSAPNTSGNWE